MQPEALCPPADLECRLGVVERRHLAPVVEAGCELDFDVDRTLDTLGPPHEPAHDVASQPVGFGARELERVEQPKCAGCSREVGLQDHCVGDVLARDTERVLGSDRPRTAAFVEQPRKRALRVETGGTPPIDRTRPVYECRARTVREQCVVGDRALHRGCVPRPVRPSPVE